MSIWRPIRLLAVEISRLVVRESEVKRLEVRDVVLIGMIEVGIDRAILGEFGAGLFKGGLGERVVRGTEVEVHDGAALDILEEGRVEA